MKKEHCARAFARPCVHGVVHGLCLVLCFIVISDVRADEEQVKRVLIVHSFGSSAPPFTTHSTAFETTLTQEMGKRVDLDQVSLDMARYAQPDMEEVFVEFLLKRLAKWHPNLVVPIGSPAGRFVVKFRDRLFPGTPVIYTGMDRRTVPPDAITKNATFVGDDFKLAGLVEDILQLAPDTTHIEVILGATPLERYWTTEFRRALEPFTNRVSFNFLNDLSFEEMLGRLSKLPPRSFILLGLFLRDASGVTHNEDEALQRLHAVANAPINGLYQNQLGLGIVGGRLYQGELQGMESARIAIRVLRGEPMSSFPPMFVGTQRPRYDWRELQRWNISESRLPPDSVIEFRQPTAWDRYKWYIAGVLIIIAIQAALISDLLLQRRRRRRAEASLSESRQFIDLATEAGGVGLWVRDLARGTLWGNARLRTLLGLDESDRLNIAEVTSRIHPDDLPQLTSMLEEPQEGAAQFNVEFRALVNGGPARWITATGQSVRGSHGQLQRHMGTMIDISARKQAEAELNQERKFLRQVIDIEPNFIFAKDREGRFTLANQALADAYGTTVENLIGKTDADFNSNHDEVEFFRRVDQEVIATSRERFIAEERMTDARGKIRWLQTMKRPILAADGSGNQVLGASSDITRRKQTELELQEQRAELAHVARIWTMGELAASLAHELNQPLTAILSNAQAALRFLSGKPADIEEVRETLQDIVKDNSRASEVIRRMRALAKKEAPEFAPLDLASLIRDVVVLLHSDAILQNVNIALELDDDVPAVRGDKVQLQQVVLNLMLNAFDAMKDSPMSKRSVKLRLEDNGAGLVQASVRDRGTGLSGDKLDKIFEPFYTTKREGLGMGLSICRSIIETHGGRLWAENNVDSGATFNFTVPVEERRG